MFGKATITHILVCSKKQQSLHILHHVPFLRLSPRCGILSWTWPSVCFLTRLFSNPLKIALFSAALPPITRLTAKQRLWFTCDLGRFANLYCICICITEAIKSDLSISECWSAFTCRTSLSLIEIHLNEIVDIFLEKSLQASRKSVNFWLNGPIGWRPCSSC